MMLIIAVLSVLICASFGVSVYFFTSINKALVKNKIRVSQISSAVRELQKQTKLCEEKLDNIIVLIQELDIKATQPEKTSGSIERQYVRAKRILKNNVLNHDDLLSSCDMTNEEIELLSGLIHHHE